MPFSRYRFAMAILVWKEQLRIESIPEKLRIGRGKIFPKYT